MLAEKNIRASGKDDEDSLGILILAAGSSSRMGKSKQLLLIQGESLLRKITKVALSVTNNVLVVLGANEHAHRQAIINLPARAYFNPEWEMGIGSSVKSGLNNLLAHTHSIEAVIILVCDQPHVNVNHLKKLIESYRSTGRSIVASGYSGTWGVPVLFNHAHFKELMELANEHGAKKIIQQNLEALTLVDFPEGSIDLDTPEDYDNFDKQIKV